MNSSYVNSFSVVRRNTCYFLCFLYLQDVFWLALSRVNFASGQALYNVAPFDWLYLLEFATLALGFSLVCVFFCYVIRPFGQIASSRCLILAVLLVSIILNFISVFIIGEGARYESGGLTGVGGIVYVLKQSFSLASVVIILRHKSVVGLVPARLVLLFAASLAVTIDGLASALYLGVFLFLYLDVKVKSPFKLALFGGAGAGLFWFGIAAKFSVLPDYFTPSFMLDWTIARFSIQAEQAYNYLSGESIIGRDVQYLELVLNAFSNRLDLVLGDPVFFSYPRSLSEALLFDMTGGYGGGSSPGVLLNTILQGPFFFMVPLMLSVIFMQFFYGFKEKFSLLKSLHIRSCLKVCMRIFLSTLP